MVDDIREPGIPARVPGAGEKPTQPPGQKHADPFGSAAKVSHSPNTRRSYSSAWKRFASWCEAENCEALPANPETVAGYLSERAAAGSSIPTLQIARAAIRYFHQERGLENPAASAGVARVFRGLRRRAANSSTTLGRGQAKGLTAQDLEAIRATAHLPRTGPTGRREPEKTARRRGDFDIALVSVMRDALLPRSEAVALTWADVEFRADGSSRITIRKSNKEGLSAPVQYIGPDATAALKAIRGNAATTDPVFRLRSGRSVANRIAAMARAAGLGDGYSGHSPRIGMAMDLAESGASTTELMTVGRWRAHRMPAIYTRGKRAGKGAVARFYSRDSA